MFWKYFERRLRRPLVKYTDVFHNKAAVSMMTGKIKGKKMSKYQGGCSCGEVQYSFEGDSINSVFCYCKSCQVHTGSDKWFGLWVGKDKLTITQGNPSTYTRKGDSGQDINHLFCATCGTTVCVEVTVGNFYSVAVSSLHGDHQITPNMAIYTASAPVWAVFPEGVPKFDILPPGLDG